MGLNAAFAFVQNINLDYKSYRMLLFFDWLNCGCKRCSVPNVISKRAKTIKPHWESVGTEGEEEGAGAIDVVVQICVNAFPGPRMMIEVPIGFTKPLGHESVISPVAVNGPVTELLKVSPTALGTEVTGSPLIDSVLLEIVGITGLALTAKISAVNIVSALMPARPEGLVIPVPATVIEVSLFLITSKKHCACVVW